MHTHTTTLMESTTNKSEKRKKIIYWIFTVWMSLGMASSAIVQLIKMPEEVEMFRHLEYPVYFMTLLGILKIAGVITMLVPKLPLLKEWAYAGFVFTMVGALYSHIATGDPFGEIFPPVLLLTLTLLSWYFRPANRKVAA